MAADMCVAVVKYSHATGVKSDNTIPWTHIVATNLFLVLKGEETHIQNGQLVLQVVQGNSALETIDIGELVDQAVEARYGSQQAGITPQIEQLPIFGIHKEVFLALRYRLPNGQARRVQFRLQSTQDCSSMVDILERRGMEFQQQRPRTGRPASARPDAPGNLMRPSTAQTYYAKSTFDTPTAPSNPSPFHLQPLEAGGLSSQTLGDASRFPKPDHGTAGQPSLLQTTSKALRQALEGTDTTHISNNDVKRSFSTADPSSSQDRTSWSDSEILSRPGTVATQQTTLNAMSHNPRSLTYSQSGIERPSTSLSTLDKISPSNFSIAETTGKPSGDDRTPTDRSNGLYQPSAPASLRMPETLEHEMPPRRELPFKRPGSHQSTSSRPSTSARSGTQFTAAQSSDLTSAPSTLSPVAKNINVRPATASPLKRAIAPVYPEPTKKAFAVERRPQSHAMHLPDVTHTSASVHNTASEGSFRRPSDLGDLLRATKQSAERSASINKVHRSDSTADAEYELETPPGTSSSPTKPHAQMTYSSPSRTAAAGMVTPVNKPVSPQRPVSPIRSTNAETSANSVLGGPSHAADAASLADYASQSQEDRQTVLDEFMVSKLADSNFAVLCEDLDSCWRRIALGL